MAPPGLTALGAKGSVRDRLTPPGRVEGSALGSYEAPLRWRCGRPYGRHFLYRLWRRKPDDRASPEGKQANLALLEAMHPPLVAGATTFPPRWEACHWILSRLRLPANPVPLPPQFGRAAKGKRLNGQARRLTSPHLEVLCRTSTGDYKAPLCCELLMTGLLCGSLLSHRSAGGRWCRKAPKGGKATGGG